VVQTHDLYVRDNSIQPVVVRPHQLMKLAVSDRRRHRYHHLWWYTRDKNTTALRINVQAHFSWGWAISVQKYFDSALKTSATLSQGQPRDAPYITSVLTPNPPTNFIPVHNLQ